MLYHASAMIGSSEVTRSPTQPKPRIATLTRESRRCAKAHAHVVFHTSPMHFPHEAADRHRLVLCRSLIRNGHGPCGRWLESAGEGGPQGPACAGTLSRQARLASWKSRAKSINIYSIYRFGNGFGTIR